VKILTWLAAALLVLAGGGELVAQDAWPTSFLPGNEIARGPGSYFSIWKLVVLCVVVWIWIKSADWVGRDTDEIGDAIGMPARIWNPIIVFVPLLGLLLAVTIPIFFAGCATMLVIYDAQFVIYVVQRNGKVRRDKKVLTPDHLKHWFADLGKKKHKERAIKHPWQARPPVEFHPVGPLQMENHQALIEARQSPGFVANK